MRYIDSSICITFWLLAALGSRATPQDDSLTPNSPASTATIATLPDLIMRTQSRRRGRPRKNPFASTTPSMETTSPYIPQRLTDPPSTKKKPRKKEVTYVYMRLTEPPTSPRPKDPSATTLGPESTTYKLSVTPVVLPPRKLKSPKSIRNDCLQFGIIPDLFNSSPPYPMQVRFLFEFVPEFGNSLDPKDLIYRPYYVIWPNNKTDFYSLMMIDIDYPSRGEPYMRSYQHWLVVNIRGDDWIRADCWSEYIGPNPLYGSGLHRYVFLVFKQPKFIHFKDLRYPEIRLDEHRANFSVGEFERKYDLKLHAMNFFQAQWMCDFVYPDDRIRMMENYPLDNLDDKTIKEHFGDISHF